MDQSWGSSGVEQLFCKQWVGGSNPSLSSNFNFKTMKKLFFILLAVMVSYSVNCQFHFVQAVYEPQTYPITHADTMTINKADLISGITIDVPSSATDSTWVKGGTNTIDGIATGYVKVPPGNSVSLGFNPDMRLDSVTIIVKNKANLYLTPIR